MSRNYVYTPPSHNNEPIDYRNSPYLGQFYIQTHSPFVPPGVISPYPSPYGTPYTTPAAVSVPLPPSPDPNSAPLPTYPTFVPFPATGDPTAYNPYVSTWQRERRSSWNGQIQPSSPYMYTPFRATPVRQRTRSFADPDTAPFSPPTNSPYIPYAYQAAPAVEPILHPYLDGSIPRHDIAFDLGMPQFRPMRLVGNNQFWPLHPDELNQTATHPQIYKITVSCDYWIPDWPIHLDFRSNDPYNTNVPPIKLGDVLCAIHAALQKRISQQDWARLNHDLEYNVTKAYTKRCKAMGRGQLTTRNQGVKQLDFLLGRTRFRGLLKVGDSLEHMKLIVG